MSLSRTLAAALVLCTGLAVPASAAAERTETPALTPPGFSDVRKSLVTIDAPLPAGVIRDAPAACQQASMTRMAAGGPSIGSARPWANNNFPPRALKPASLTSSAVLKIQAWASMRCGSRSKSNL